MDDLLSVRRNEADQRPDTGKFHLVAIPQPVFALGSELKAVDARAVGAAQVFDVQAALMTGDEIRRSVRFVYGAGSDCQRFR